jgi:hypothetical protein
MSGCGTTAHCETIGMVRGAKVPFDGGVVTMGTVGVTMLQPKEVGKLVLPPSLEVESSSLADSSRMECSDGDLLQAKPTNIAPESFPSGERLRLLEQSVMNSWFPRGMVLPQASSALSRCNTLIFIRI